MFSKRPDNKRPNKIVRFQKQCMFCKEKPEIDYKNISMLSRYVNSKGRITSRKLTGNCAKHQRKVAKEIKRARFLALLPHVAR